MNHRTRQVFPRCDSGRLRGYAWPEWTGTFRLPMKSPATPSGDADPSLRRADHSEQNHEATSRRAFELWKERGRPAGHEAEIWLEAERETTRGDVPPDHPENPRPPF